MHHGLQTEADAWLAQARSHCEALAAAGAPLRFLAERLPGGPAPGESIEAWAREGRYAALTRLAQHAGATLVLLAHHRRDQAETVLLQLLRGAGPAGLAAMPRSILRGGIVWARPWLDRPREEIEAYRDAWRIAAVDDPSNRDARHARGRLRDGWPAARAAFPQLEPSLARAAARAAAAAAALAELADIDLAGCRISPHALRVAAWLALSPARRENLLRSWLPAQGAGRGADALVARLLAELPAAHAAGRSMRWPIAAGGELRLYRGELRRADAPSCAPAVPPAERPLAIAAPGRYPCPEWGGVLVVSELAAGEPGEGIAPSWMSAARMRGRGPGVRFQRGLAGAPRSLKKQFQQAGAAAWSRHGPLVFAGTTLLFVAGLGIDGRVVAPVEGRRWSLRWECAGAPAGSA